MYVIGRGGSCRVHTWHGFWSDAVRESHAHVAPCTSPTPVWARQRAASRLQRRAFAWRVRHRDSGTVRADAWGRHACMHDAAVIARGGPTRGTGGSCGEMRSSAGSMQVLRVGGERAHALRFDACELT